MSKNFRQGAVGALLDEYERAITELKEVIETIPDTALTIITDPQTGDENCRSVQTILSHVISSGYGYAISIQNIRGHQLIRPSKIFHTVTRAYINDLNGLFSFTENVFEKIHDHELEQQNDLFKIKAGWGQLYDIEQMMEHAIVHILRHRRQLEKIKLTVLKIQ